VRPLDCSRRETNDLLGRHPASSGRTYHARAPGGVGGHAARLRREVGEGPLSSTPTESMVARVALGGPPASLAPQPSAPAPTHRSEPRRPPPYAPQIDRASEPALASEAPSCSAISPRLPTRAAASGYEPASATPGRTGGARERGHPTGVPGEFARPRRQLSPEGSARARSTRRGPRLGALAFGSVGPAIPSCTEDSVDSAMPRSLELGIKTVDTFSAPHLGGPYKVRRERQGHCSATVKVARSTRPSAAPCPAPRA
jgi:hypothetical protein